MDYERLKNNYEPYEGMVELRKKNRLKSNYFIGEQQLEANEEIVEFSIIGLSSN